MHNNNSDLGPGMNISREPSEPDVLNAEDRKAMARLAGIEAPGPSASLWPRIEASLEADSARRDAYGRWRGVVAIAAGVAAIWAFWRPTPTLEAGMVSGSMVLTPAMPGYGEVVSVRYTAGALLGRPATLRLRARVRNRSAGNYTTGVPVITLATLERTSGNEYRGQFVLPDSLVFAALAVEDEDAREVDDFGGRTWEVMRSGSDGTPLLDALVQRMNDLMGRSFEEGLATARRAVALYPDSLAAWDWLNNYETWMGLANDSTSAVHLVTARKMSGIVDAPDVDGEVLGNYFWYIHTFPDPDTTLAQTARKRLLQEFPANGFAVQEQLIDVLRQLHFQQKDSASAIAELEKLWTMAQDPDRKSQVAGIVPDLIAGSSDSDARALREWLERAAVTDTSIGSRRARAQRLLEIPSLKEEGLQELRDLLTVSDDSVRIMRALEESRSDFLTRLSHSRSLTLAALGRALADDKRYEAARDTLLLATRTTHDPDLSASLASVWLALGDSAAAAAEWSHVVVDPRTNSKRADSLSLKATSWVGPERWQDLKANALSEMVSHTMLSARRRVVDDVLLSGIDGSSARLSGLRSDKGMVVVFWSPHCGPAVEKMPAVQELANRLARQNMPLVAIVTDAESRTPKLDSLIKAQKLSIPMYLDAGGKAADTFNNWGTPMIYVLDATGRVVFNGTSDVPRALLNAEVVMKTGERVGGQ